MKWVIHCDDQRSGEWFKARSPDFKDAPVHRFRTKRMPAEIQRLLGYDRPDIILVGNGKARLVVEITREVPTGHNVGQRFARVVKAAEEGVPIIYVTPFRSKKHGKYASACNIPVRLFDAFKNLEKIHDTTVLAVEWPADENAELVGGNLADKKFEELIDELLKIDFDFSRSSVVRETIKFNAEFAAKLDQSTRELPPSCVIENTKKYISELRKHELISSEQNSMLSAIVSREKSLIYTIGMTVEKCKRQDPYTGQQFIYDYQVCRTGPDQSAKNINLILRFPKIPKEKWLLKNPNDPKTKSAMWYVTADMMVFQDGVYLREEWLNGFSKIDVR